MRKPELPISASRSSFSSFVIDFLQGLQAQNKSFHLPCNEQIKNSPLWYCACRPCQYVIYRYLLAVDFTYMFEHSDVSHLSVNMYTQMLYTILALRPNIMTSNWRAFWVTFQIVSIYFASGVVASVLFRKTFPDKSVVGASAACYGMAGLAFLNVLQDFCTFIMVWKFPKLSSSRLWWQTSQINNKAALSKAVLGNFSRQESKLKRPNMH